MDTLLQNLRSALQTLSGHPAFTLAAAMSLGLSLQNGPARRLPERRTVRVARVVAPAPHRSPSWMDYIDFRRGSGDVLRWIGSTDSDEWSVVCGRCAQRIVACPHHRPPVTDHPGDLM